MAPHLIVALIHLGLVFVAFRAARRRREAALAMAGVVGVALAYDAAVLAVGGTLDEGAVLRLLNAPRYWTHALLTPTTMWVALAGLGATGYEPAASRTWRAAVGSLIAVMVVLGSWIDIVGLTLEPVTEDGITRYVNAFSPMPGPPVAAVVTIVVVAVFGVIVWRHSGWPWLAIGAAVMFITAGLQGQLVAQHVGEIAYMAGLISTLTWGRPDTSAGTVVGQTSP